MGKSPTVGYPGLTMTMHGSRLLTAGEIEMARSIFGDAIDYPEVRLVRGKWWPFQPRNVVMAPTGNIHFHPDSQIWSDDFAKSRLSLQGLFVHEMTHILQAQQRGRYYLPLMRHPFCRYGYRFGGGRPFERYGLEQQAELARHLFLANQGFAVEGAPSLAELRSLVPFASSARASSEAADV